MAMRCWVLALMIESSSFNPNLIAFLSEFLAYSTNEKKPSVAETTLASELVSVSGILLALAYL